MPNTYDPQIIQLFNQLLAILALPNTSSHTSSEQRKGYAEDIF